MGILPPSAEKYKFEGIGGASAAAVMAVLASNPSTSWLTVGVIPGKVVNYILSRIFGVMASQGVVIINVGADKLLTAMEKSEFDGSLETSYRLIEEIRASGRDLTPEEAKEIDDKVIVQFRKFARLTRKKA